MASGAPRLTLLGAGGCVAVLAVIADAVGDESHRPVRVRYSVTGDAWDVNITYAIWKDGNLASSGMSGVRLPWRVEVETTGFVRSGSLVVTVGASGGRAACSVAVDGEKPHTATATGRFAVATCDG
ncbi:MmpS family transport accessory protein [Streptomyces hypolithicus]